MIFWFKRQADGNKKAGDGKPGAKSSPQLDSSSLPLLSEIREGWFGEKGSHWENHTWIWKHHQLSPLSSWSIKERPDLGLTGMMKWDITKILRKESLGYQKGKAMHSVAGHVQRWLKNRTAGRLSLALLALSISCIFQKKKMKSIFASVSHWYSFCFPSLSSTSIQYVLVI